MAEEKQKLGGVYALLVVCMVLSLIASFGAFSNQGPSAEEIQKLVSEEVAKVEIPSVPSAEEIAKLVVIPEVTVPESESANNEHLNEFLEREFAAEYEEIELAAEADAMAEFEDDDYEVVFDYLESLGDAVDEDSLDVDLDEVEVEVTALGLKEDSDKCALVFIEFEVEYELEEGVREDYELDLVAEYTVCYEEGDFSDEEVELVALE